MNRLHQSDRAGSAAALAAIGFAGIAVFQVAVAAGAPWGHAAWGGAHAHLSTSQRLGSVVAAFVWTAAAFLVLGRGGLWSAGRRVSLYRQATWFVVALLVAGSLANFASQSRWENFIFGPLSLILAILCIVVARSAVRGQPRRNVSTRHADKPAAT